MRPPSPTRAHLRTHMNADVHNSKHNAVVRGGYVPYPNIRSAPEAHNWLRERIKQQTLEAQVHSARQHRRHHGCMCYLFDSSTRFSTRVTDTVTRNSVPSLL